MKTKTKTVEVPELKLKLTIEWQEPDEQFELALQTKTLFDIEQEVWARVTGLEDTVVLAQRNNHQMFAHARHIFCFVSCVRYNYSTDNIAAYLKRSGDSIKHSIKRVSLCCKKKDGALWAAYKRWEQ